MVLAMLIFLSVLCYNGVQKNKYVCTILGMFFFRTIQMKVTKIPL